MKARSEVDPELHTLRTVARNSKGKHRHQLESARFHLYVAFEQQQAADALRWLQAMRAALVALQEQEDLELRRLGLAALDTIETAIA